MTIGIFLPAFVLPIFLHGALVAVAENPQIARSCSASPPRSSARLPPSWSTFAILYRFHGKLTALHVMLGCGAIGALLRLTLL